MEHTRQIVDYDPSSGQGFQGDVSIIPLPTGIVPDLTHEIAAVGGRLILQEGEVSGHHHAIALASRDDLVRTNVAVERLISDALANKIALPSARLYRDPAAAAEMVCRGIITRADLIIGLLIVEGGPMVLRHEEHDGIRIPPGAYLIGRQVESAGAEERRIRD